MDEEGLATTRSKRIKRSRWGNDEKFGLVGKGVHLKEQQQVNRAMLESKAASVEAGHEERPYRHWNLLEMLMHKKLATLAGEESDKLILTTTDGSICGLGVQEDLSAERALCDVCEAGG
eukprot:6212056-Pleurochrysis_carterae.AAC.1